MQWAGINPYRGEGSGGAWGPGPRELSWPWGRSHFRGYAMVQKIIEVVGRSGKSFADAAKDAVAVAARTVRGMRWARVSELEMELKNNKVVDYRATVKIYFDVE